MNYIDTIYVYGNYSTQYTSADKLIIQNAAPWKRFSRMLVKVNLLQYKKPMIAKGNISL